MASTSVLEQAGHSTHSASATNQHHCINVHTTLPIPLATHYDTPTSSTVTLSGSKRLTVIQRPPHRRQTVSFPNQPIQVVFYTEHIQTPYPNLLPHSGNCNPLQLKQPHPQPHKTSDHHQTSCYYKNTSSNCQGLFVFTTVPHHSMSYQEVISTTLHHTHTQISVTTFSVSRSGWLHQHFRFLSDTYFTFVIHQQQLSHKSNHPRPRMAAHPCTAIHHPTQISISTSPARTFASRKTLRAKLVVLSTCAATPGSPPLTNFDPYWMLRQILSRTSALFRYITRKAISALATSSVAMALPSRLLPAHAPHALPILNPRRRPT